VTHAARLALRRLRLLAAGVTLGVGLAIAAGLMAGAREHLQELQRGTVEALAAAIASDLDRVGPDGSALRAVLVPMARAADARQRAWQLVVQDATGAPLANLAAAVPLSGAAVVATRQVAAGPLAGARVTVTMADTTDRNLALLVGGLMAGLVIGLLLGLEVLTFLAARLLVAPARELSALANAGAAGDFRRIPPAGGVGELGALRHALASLVVFLTLRRREVDLLLQDARRDTYDPELVARAEGQLQLLDSLARTAPEDPLRVPLDGDPALQRLLIAAGALLLGLHAMGGGQVLVLLAAAAFVGWRLLTWLPRLLGRRVAILLAGVAGTVAAFLLPPLAALAAGAAALASVLRSATGAAGEPAGADGFARDAAALAGAGVGAAVAGALAGMTGLSVPDPLILPAGIALIAGFALMACSDRLERPGDTAPFRPAALREVLAVRPICVVVAGQVVPSGVAVGLALLVALEAGAGGWALLALGLGLWAAGPLAGLLPARPFAATAAHLLAVLALAAAAQPMWLPPLLAAWLAGVAAATLWRAGSAALHAMAWEFRGVAPEQATLRLGLMLRFLAVLASAAALSASDLGPLATGTMAVAAAGVLAVAALRMRALPQVP
jgi:HAMP domain-containing protein